MDRFKWPDQSHSLKLFTQYTATVFRGVVKNLAELQTISLRFANKGESFCFTGCAVIDRR